MKKFENPTMEVEMLSVADVIATSGGGCASDCGTFSCPTDTGCPVDW